MEKERLVFLFLLLFSSCASHHTRGRVLSRLGPTEGVMLVESDSVKSSDHLRIVRRSCHVGFRGNIICRNDDVGKATVEADPSNGEARFRTPANVDFRRDDLLEPID